MNYRAVGGSLKVEVLDENNTVVPGYSQADCVALTGDSVTQAVTWATHTALPTGASRISLRFILQNASLYSFMAGQSAALVDVPTITQQPANQTVAQGGTASFTVAASAISPLSYQWQKNQVNLTNGGHYSGCTAATLTITDADSADAATVPLCGDQCLRERDQQPGNAGSGVECRRLGHPHPHPHPGGRYEQ